MRTVFILQYLTPLSSEKISNTGTEDTYIPTHPSTYMCTFTVKDVHPYARVLYTHTADTQSSIPLYT